MKFRIKEVKNDGPWRAMFIPQIKGFWGWNNIGDWDHDFVDSCWNTNDDFDYKKTDVLGYRQVYTQNLYDAENVIKQYKKFLEARTGYEKIHEIKD